MRDRGIDAAKFVLLILVALGHLIEEVHTPAFEYIYRAVYLFHMPAFVFLSGLVSGALIDEARARRIVGAILLPLIVHHLCLQWLDTVLSGTTFAVMPYRPNWALWYLMSLLLWRLMLPLLMAFRFPLMLAVGVALAAGFFNRIGYDWSVSRTAVFLPFFVAGHLWALRKGRTLPAYSHRVALIGLAEVALLGWLALRVDARWLYGSLSYESLGVPWAQGLGYRASLIAIGFVGTLCVLSLIPSWPLLARLGERSMAAFIVHIYVVKILVAGGGGALLGAIPAVIGVPVAILTAATIIAAGALIGAAFPRAFDLTWMLGSGGTFGGRIARSSE